MFRNTFAISSVLITLISASGQVAAQGSTQVALQLAIDRNMGVRVFDDRCLKGFSGYKNVTSAVILIPINKEVIDAVIDHKAELEGMDSAAKERLRTANYMRYLYGDVAAFALLVKNGVDFDNRSLARFIQFETLTYLWDESEQHALVRYTHIFDESLNPGWNRGFLYFPNFRSEECYSYSIHFSKYFLMACASNRGKSYAWAFSFDETELNMLALLQEGLSEGTLRERYNVPSYVGRGLSASDMLTVMGILLTVVTLAD